MDDDGSKSLSLPEFKKALTESGISLSDGETQTLFNFFDSDNSQSISFDEFLLAIRVCKFDLKYYIYCYQNVTVIKIKNKT